MYINICIYIYIECKYIYIGKFICVCMYMARTPAKKPLLAKTQ